MANWNIKNDLVNGDRLLFYLVSGTTSAQTVEQAITSDSSGSTCKVIAYATSVSIQIDNETIDVSSKFSCRWSSNYGGRNSYTISCDALYCQKAQADGNNAVSFDVLMDIMTAGGTIGWVVGQEVETDNCATAPHSLDKTKPYYYGSAAIASLSLEGGSNEIASSSISLNGDGPIYRAN